jgi:lysyl-tRNA synthetase class 1
MTKSQEQFWAKKVAREAIEFATKHNHEIVTVRSGASPSGPKHIGNMNDQVRGEFIRKSIENYGSKARLVLTSDDMDPLRTIPARLQENESKWVKTDEKILKILEPEVGKPVSKVLDPFGCHNSYAEHFTDLMMEGLKKISVYPELYYVSKLYKEGKYDWFIAETIRKKDAVREVLKKYQQNIPDDYIAFVPVCENCGKLTTKVTGVDLENMEVEYECTGRVLHGKYEIKGCGHKGKVNIRKGKLPWRLEWVADWKIFNTDAEPFGKEHFEGSWKSGKELAKRIYKFDPPVPLVYEFFLVDGEKMSSRLGNVYTIQDLLKIVEPEVVRYMYVKKPLVQRDIAVKEVYKLVDEFDEIERLAYEGRGERAEEAKNYYWYCVGELKDRRPYRLPYRLAATIVQFYPPEVALERLTKSGIVPDNLSDEERQKTLTRLKLAKQWVEEFSDRKLRIAEANKEHYVKDEKIMHAFNYVYETYKNKEMNGEELQALFYEAARKFELNPSEFFKQGYLIFLGEEHGPRLGNFLASLDKDYVLKVMANIKLKK